MTQSSQEFVGEILVRRGALTDERMRELVRTASEKDTTLVELLTVTREIELSTLVKALADEVGIAFVEKIKPEDVPQHLVDLIPITFARQHGVLGLSEDADGTLRIAVRNPLDPTPIDDLQALLKRPVQAVAATQESIEDAINRIYERKDEGALSEAKEGEVVEELQDLIDMTDEAPVIRWVNNLFYNAVRDRASDIHIEPTDKEVVVRFRVDGNLAVAKTAHRGFLASIVSRVKIEAGLNIAEKRLPQDGRITKKIQGRLIDVRVSTIPTAKGERIVMRLLDKEKVLLDLTDLGYAGAQLEGIQHLITRPNGIILVTGPTGSGKTTTLYACLSRINTPDLNILTAEDPVEYELRGIGQLHVQPKIGLSFASALRAFLRQDPDVIMVGEIRDHETAEIAIHASLTGHLVMSTLHTNDAAGSITRLIEMGVQPYLITSSLLAVIAQRLVRKLCPHCRQPYEPSDEDMRSLGIDRSRLQVVLSSSGLQPLQGMRAGAMGDEVERLSEPPSSGEFGLLEHENTRVLRDAQHNTRRGLRSDKHLFYRPVGCEECSQTGYRGRVAIAEVLVVDDAVRRDVLNQCDSGAITKTAAGRGMRTLREDGARLVVQGTTSVEEVIAATQAAESEVAA